MSAFHRTLTRAVFRTQPGHWDSRLALVRLFTQTTPSPEPNCEGRIFDTIPAGSPELNCEGRIFDTIPVGSPRGSRPGGRPSIWRHGYLEKEGEKGDVDYRLGKVSLKEPPKSAGLPRPGLPRLVKHWRMEKEETTQETDASLAQQGTATEHETTTTTTQAETTEVGQQTITQAIEEAESKEQQKETSEITLDTPERKPGRSAKPEKLEKFQRLRYEKADRKGHLFVSKSPRTGDLSKAEQQRLAEIDRREAERQAYFLEKLERDRQKKAANRLKMKEESEEENARAQMKKEKKKAKKEKKRERREMREEEKKDRKNLGEVEE
ncbi:hypothetical protein BJ508DRAFT_417155 [Ascobolus immersus RN42]|uniref:Uncharacterized protein n=1 Tax=Ascobolus immersus RN42 TaxID=1160509 RepID=A0A3N4HZG4_ASCIM|nr:hypothetical protein BJ508DRAFT_417155 [Ascobolus immersus RN42]